MSSVIVAKTLNSSLGTPNFRSFDQFIANNVRLIQSDNAFYVYDGEWVSSDNGKTETTAKSIVFGISGTVGIYMTVSTGAEKFYVEVSKDDEVIARSTNNTPILKINVSDGESFKFKVYTTSNYSIDVKELYIGAIVAPCNKFCALI